VRIAVALARAQLMEFMRSLYHQRAYQEVITPQLFSKTLWETSGHWDNYKEDMFVLELPAGKHDGGLLGLKPMNCPGHCLIFDHEYRSYRELPVRLADFSPLHRYARGVRRDGGGLTSSGY